MSKQIIAEAAQHIVDSYEYDEVIDLRTLDDLLETTEPEQGTIDEFKAAAMVRMTRIDALGKLLLKQHKLLFKNVFGEGYVLVNPENQVKVAMQESRCRVAKELNKASARVRNLRVDEISNRARQEQEDAHNKLAAMQQFLKRNK